MDDDEGVAAAAGVAKEEKESQRVNGKLGENLICSNRETRFAVQVDFVALYCYYRTSVNQTFFSLQASAISHPRR